MHKLNEEQIESICSDIHQLAGAIEIMIREAINETNPNKAGTILWGADSLTSQIKWMSDLATGSQMGETAESCLLPPSMTLVRQEEAKA